MQTSLDFQFQINMRLTVISFAVFTLLLDYSFQETSFLKGSTNFGNVNLSHFNLSTKDEKSSAKQISNENAVTASTEKLKKHKLMGPKVGGAGNILNYGNYSNNTNFYNFYLHKNKQQNTDYDTSSEYDDNVTKQQSFQTESSKVTTKRPQFDPDD